jgi:hypothetical protein
MNVTTVGSAVLKTGASQATKMPVRLAVLPYEPPQTTIWSQ